MFHELGQQAVTSSVKSALQKGLGEPGLSLFHIQGPEGKPDGTKGKPFHVIVDEDAGGAAGLPGQIPGGTEGLKGLGGFFGKIGGFFGSLFSGGGGSGLAESVTSSIQFMAGGGDVDPGHPYIVGEMEPELFSPRTAGTITPLSKMMGSTYHIDARGAQIGVENRIARTMEAVHNSAVSSGVQASAERSRRVPQRRS